MTPDATLSSSLAVKVAGAVPLPCRTPVPVAAGLPRLRLYGCSNSVVRDTPYPPQTIPQIRQQNAVGMLYPRLLRNRINGRDGDH